MLTVLLILNSVCRLEPPGNEFDLEYVRPAAGRFVRECTVSLQKTADGYLFQSVTLRPSEKMRLRLRWDARNLLRAAELEQETAAGKQTATAHFDGKSAVVKRPGRQDQQVTLAAEPVLATTAPDWSDILLLLRRYDPKQGGKQQFAGLWLHPAAPPRGLTFDVEELGKDTITAGDQKLTLVRFRVQLRSGAYLVWADGQGKVFKLMPPGQPQAAVILKGQEKSTSGLIGQ